MLFGREDFWRVLGRDIGTGDEDRVSPKLVWEPLPSRAGLDSAGLESGLEDVEGLQSEDEGRNPFLKVTGGALSGAESCMGVKLVNEGLKMLRLFLLLRSDIVLCQRRPPGTCFVGFKLLAPLPH